MTPHVPLSFVLLPPESCHVTPGRLPSAGVRPRPLSSSQPSGGSSVISDATARWSQASSAEPAGPQRQLAPDPSRDATPQPPPPRTVAGPLGRCSFLLPPPMPITARPQGRPAWRLRVGTLPLPFWNTEFVLRARTATCLIPLPTISRVWVGGPAPSNTACLTGVRCALSPFCLLRTCWPTSPSK